MISDSAAPAAGALSASRRYGDPAREAGRDLPTVRHPTGADRRFPSATKTGHAARGLTPFPQRPSCRSGRGGAPAEADKHSKRARLAKKHVAQRPAGEGTLRRNLRRAGQRRHQSAPWPHEEEGSTPQDGARSCARSLHGSRTERIPSEVAGAGGRPMPRPQDRDGRHLSTPEHCLPRARRASAIQARRDSRRAHRPERRPGR